MVLTETGESRLRGYLYVLERSLALALPRAVVEDARREIESHLRERIAAVPAGADERGALEQILAEVGPPLRVAQAYSTERVVDEAVVTGGVIPMVRAIWQVALTSVAGFLAVLALMVGYLTGAAFLAIAILKPIFPNNVGFWRVNGPESLPTSLGILFPAEGTPAGGNWVILIGLVCGLGALVLTHLGARRYLGWWRARRRGWIQTGAAN
ncbi:MAG TPA: hypothetical protein VFK57_10405 [Vicinamibacterales bacterium]|nr:hypothetical protein [Vicinamibacterales bacterium]